MYSAVALFCEDIREEKSGMDTLVGVLPDNIVVPSIPFIFAKLGVYLRILVPVSGDPESISYWMSAPDPLNFPRTNVPLETIAKAKTEARDRGGANGGLITKAMIGMFQVNTAGRLNVHVKINEQEVVAGTLNIQMADA